jgi:DNA mismatch repair ATPase MutS
MLTINEIRTENAGKICLLWRGNLYESFDGDAYIVARVCGSRISRIHRDERVRNVAAFPARELHGNLEKLKAAGYAVELLEHIDPRIP